MHTAAAGEDLIEHLREYIAWTDRTKGPLFVGGRGPLISRGASLTANRLGNSNSVYSCDGINRAGAEALGRDIEHGLQRLEEILG